MRNRYILSVLGMVMVVVTSCHREAISITYFKQLQSVDGKDIKEDSLILPSGCIEYDTVRFSDGSYAVHRLKNGPQNRLAEFFDQKGRTIATIARASECFAQTLVYGYDEKGRLIHLIEYKGEIFDGLDPDSASFERTQEGYLGFRQMIANIDYQHPDTAQYLQTNIEYDEEGNAVKAYRVYGKDSIVAPSGYKLTVAVKPCLSFWQSDLHGGFYIFHVTMEPKRKDLPKYKVCRFADYMPSMESEYRNGYIVKTVWHHDSYTDAKDKDLTFIPIRNGEMNVYSITWDDGSIHQRAYKKGLLAYEQVISKYGTVLKKKSYSFVAGNKAKVVDEVIDYKTKTLQLQDVSVIDVPNMEKYHEDMHVVNEYFRWENYYYK